MIQKPIQSQDISLIYRPKPCFKGFSIKTTIIASRDVGKPTLLKIFQDSYSAFDIEPMNIRTRGN